MFWHNTAKAQLLTNFMINHKKIIYLKVYFVNHIVRSFNTLLIQYGLPELCKYSWVAKVYYIALGES